MWKRASATAESGRSRLRSFLLILGIVLLAANLRPALTSVAPLIGQIRADTGMSNGVAGLLTTLPLLAFGLLSPVAPRVARRFGMERVLLASLFVLVAGILLRWAGAVAALFLGTVVLGAAIAVANVLLPSLVKREFPERAGLMTSVYSTSLGISAAFAAGVSVPLAQLAGIGWRGALAVWAVPAFLAGVAWLPQLGRSDHPADPSPEAPRGQRPVAFAPGLAGDAVHGLAVAGVLRDADVATGDPAGGGDGCGQGGVDARALSGRGDRDNVLGTNDRREECLSAGCGCGGRGHVWRRRFGPSCCRFHRKHPVGRAARSRSRGVLQPGAHLLRASISRPGTRRCALGHGPVGRLPARRGRAFLFGVLRDVTGAWTVPLALLLTVTVFLLIAGIGAARDAHVGTSVPEEAG